MRKTCTQLAILVVAVLMVLPVAVTGQDTTNATVVPVTTATGAVSPVTTGIPPNTTATIPVSTTTTVSPANATPLSNTTTQTPTETVSATAVTSVVTTTTPVPVTSPVGQVAAGNVTVASSPLGASILIDGVYYGVTPANLTGIPAGNHMVRLALSGYYDYEGTLYVLPGQVTTEFGTLPPIGGPSYTRPLTVRATPVIVTTTEPEATVQPAATSSGGTLENPSVIGAIIGGIITAVIGAAATIFTHIWKTKKE